VEENRRNQDTEESVHEDTSTGLGAGAGAGSTAGRDALTEPQDSQEEEYEDMVIE